MRTFAFCLSVYVLALATVPGSGLEALFPDVVCCEDACTAEHPASEEEEEGCGAVCNPFFSCSCCLGFIATVTIEEAPDAVRFDLRKEIVRHLLSEPVIFPVWHPPRKDLQNF